MAAELLPLARRAGSAILSHYRRVSEVAWKEDRSPVTAADREAEAIIREGLLRLAPSFPVVAEEAVAGGEVPELGSGPFWLVDPLDGTREFLSANGEFTVNIALVEDRRPVLGLVLAPALGRGWLGIPGHGAFSVEEEGRRGIRVRTAQPGRLAAVVSRSHEDAATRAWLVRHRIARTVHAGSALKFCVLAEGRADVYPRFGPTMEWDTAAGQAVLEAAGGTVVTARGEPLRYRKPEFRNPAFIAYGGLSPFPSPS